MERLFRLFEGSIHRVEYYVPLQKQQSAILKISFFPLMRRTGQLGR